MKVMLQEFVTLPNLKLSERQRLPECSAIYFAISRDQVLYVGLTSNLKNRWKNHHRFPQLEMISKRWEVRLFWLACVQNELENTMALTLQTRISAAIANHPNQENSQPTLNDGVAMD